MKPTLRKFLYRSRIGSFVLDRDVVETYRWSPPEHRSEVGSQAHVTVRRLRVLPKHLFVVCLQKLGRTKAYRQLNPCICLIVQSVRLVWGASRPRAEGVITYRINKSKREGCSPLREPTSSGKRNRDCRRLHRPKGNRTVARQQER